jgi:hypothetical protein
MFNKLFKKLFKCVHESDGTWIIDRYKSETRCKKCGKHYETTLFNKSKLK